MQTQKVVATTGATTGAITQMEVATMRATMGVMTSTITINVADATKVHQMMPLLSVRTNPNSVIYTGRSITTQVIVTGAHLATRTQQR